jgi:hypothetical protein
MYHTPPMRLSAGSRRQTKDGEEAAGRSQRSTQSAASSSCNSPASARTSAAQAQLNTDGTALHQQLAAVHTVQTAPHATGRPLGEGLEDEASMFDYHHSAYHHSVESPVARETSNISDWQIKAGRMDSCISRSRSSASLWHSEYLCCGYHSGVRHTCGRC